MQFPAPALFASWNAELRERESRLSHQLETRTYPTRRQDTDLSRIGQEARSTTHPRSRSCLSQSGKSLRSGSYRCKPMSALARPSLPKLQEHPKVWHANRKPSEEMSHVQRICARRDTSVGKTTACLEAACQWPPRLCRESSAVDVSAKMPKS